MKNTKKKIKSIRKALVISAVTMAVCIIGVLLVFVKEKRWDAAGCSILACNAAIFSCCCEALKKAEEV